MPIETRGTPTPDSPSPVYAFIQAAIDDGALARLNSGTSAWNARRQAMWDRYFFTPDNMKGIGKDYGIKPQRVSQIIHRWTRLLWQNCSPDIRAQFPLPKIPLRKPPSSFWQNYSEQHGGLSVAVLDSFQKGTTPQIIAEQLGLTGRQIATARRTLKKHGVELPYNIITPDQNRQLALDLTNPATDEEMRRLLNLVRRKFYTSYVGKSLKPVTSILRECGLHYTPQVGIAPFLEALKEAGIPFGTISYPVNSSRCPIHNYYFIASAHQERVKQALLENPGLQRFLKHP